MQNHSSMGTIVKSGRSRRNFSQTYYSLELVNTLPVDRLEMFLVISMPGGFLEERTLAGDEYEQQHNSIFVFCLNRWLVRAYAKGLTAALNISIV